MWPLWLTLTLVSGAASLVFNYFNRRTLGRGGDSTVYAWFFELCRLLFFLALIPFDYHLVINFNNLAILAALGLSELVGVYYYMKMHAHAELSISSILSRLRVILVPIAAFLFLGERLAPTQYLGIAIIFTGCLAVSVNGQVRGTKGLSYALAFIVANTFSNIFLKQATSFASTPIVTATFSLFPALLIPLLMQNVRTRLPTLRPMLRPILAAAFFNIITMYGLVSAYRLAPAGQVNSVFQGTTIFAVIIGIVFLREKNNIPLKLTGALLTTLGIILLV